MKNLPGDPNSSSLNCLPPSFDWVGFRQLLQKFSTPDFAQGYEIINQRALSLCLKVVEHYGLFRDQPPVETMESITDKIHFVPRARYLVERMMTLLTEEKYLSHFDNSWAAIRPFLPLTREWTDPHVYPHGLSVDPIFEYFRRVEENVFAFFSGRKIGPGIVFDKGNRSFWESLNNDSIFFAPYAQLAAFIAEGCMSDGARILEIGAGTGAVTARLLEINSTKMSKYLYTDVSTVFLDKGKDRFGEYPFIEFKTYDVDEPPRPQGIEEGVFDVVLGVNAIHVARDISKSLRFLRSLLRPSGRLIIGEGSPPDPHRMWRPDLLFGILDGWWNVTTDSNLRPQPGWLLPSNWQALFQDAGFVGICALPEEEYFGRDTYGGVIAGQAPGVT